MQLLLDGQRDGLACLYKLFAKDLYKYGMAICSDDHEVSECLHDFFIYLWENRTKFDNVNHPKAYLFTSFKRKLIKQLAKNKKHDELSYKHDGLISQESIEETISKEEGQVEYTLRLNKAIKNLSDREREVIHLKYFQRYKNEEIAGILEINNQSVRNLLYRAIQNLKKKL
ncbi:RNA polymerase sigma factor [Portibacter lacus]|uniref:DNA-directed RNA polymerase sigma-70 factor n=1 Tax=Portibacter lacus TaxID=1099794 RepID=A0AA37SS01_9BACT|nr:sigma-70 family RNA polymerase sigma factor [Portibacter lacus]GLR19786.1 DNA-directed RNA polymerase sigma-70 factor [Portibacter lacus]